MTDARVRDALLARLPGVPAGRRGRAAARAAHDLVGAGRPAEASRLLRSAAARTTGAEEANLRAMAVDTDLRAGVIPPDTDAVAAAALAAADGALRDGDRPGAVRLLSRAAAITFSRARHLDGEQSELAADPERFLHEWRTSTARSALLAAGVRRRATDRGTTQASDSRLRVVVVADDDLRFAAPLVEALRTADPGLEVRFLRLRAWAAGAGHTLPLTAADQIRARTTAGVTDDAWAVALRAELSDADVVWVEWCQRAAVLVSLLDLDARVVVRLHSFEAFTVFPHLVDPAGVDAVATVSPAFATLLAAVVPELAEDTVLVPNLVVRPPRRRDKYAESAVTLGLVGWAAPAKDAVWALEVLALVRSSDDRWRLRLVGRPPVDGSSYGRAVAARMAAADVAGAVDVIPETDDVDEELRHIGVILSSSTRESFHVALAEGVASGALPIVRDWPTLAPYGGPRGVWPDDWIVTSPSRAAQRIKDGRPPVDPLEWLPDPAAVSSVLSRVLRGVTTP